MRMYKCLDCGNLFENGEEATWVEPHGERLMGCPLCHGDFEETKPCSVCGSEHLEDELHEGYCLECLKEAVTYDSALSYLQARDRLVDFMIVYFYDCEDGMPYVSNEFRVAMREAYLRAKADDLLLRWKKLLDLVRQYIIDDASSCDLDDWGEFLKTWTAK